MTNECGVWFPFGILLLCNDHFLLYPFLCLETLKDLFLWLTLCPYDSSALHPSKVNKMSASFWELSGKK